MSRQIDFVLAGTVAIIFGGSALAIHNGLNAAAHTPVPDWSVIDFNLPSNSRHAMIIFKDHNGKIIDRFSTIDVPESAAGVKLYFRGE